MLLDMISISGFQRSESTTVNATSVSHRKTASSPYRQLGKGDGRPENHSSTQDGPRWAPSCGVFHHFSQLANATSPSPTGSSGSRPLPRDSLVAAVATDGRILCLSARQEMRLMVEEEEEITVLVAGFRSEEVFPLAVVSFKTAGRHSPRMPLSLSHRPTTDSPSTPGPRISY